MYLPDHFREDDPQRLAALMAGHGFATLVTVADGAPFASHLPLYHEAGDGHGTLYGHLARSNPQAAHLAAGAPLLAIFQGPHAYVSPSWYATAGVPTWNYAVVHARGRARIIDDATQLERILDRLVERYDDEVADPDGPVIAAEPRRRMLAGIVGFAIDIEELSGKYKLSQNRPAEDRQRVVARLGQSDSAAAQAVAGLMLENLVRGR
jgi:transcriptional regulator